MLPCRVLQCWMSLCWLSQGWMPLYCELLYWVLLHRVLRWWQMFIPSAFLIFIFVFICDQKAEWINCKNRYFVISFLFRRNENQLETFFQFFRIKGRINKLFFSFLSNQARLRRVCWTAKSELSKTIEIGLECKC
jgi:hypothetical protein